MKVLDLFHGQVAVESGISINKNMLIENLKDNIFIAQRDRPLIERYLQSITTSAEDLKKEFHGGLCGL